jgi:hypothetical protein
VCNYPDCGDTCGWRLKRCDKGGCCCCRGLDIYSGPPSLAGLCRLSPLFDPQYSIKVALLTPKVKQQRTSSVSTDEYQIESKNLRARQQSRSSHHFSCQRASAVAPPLTSNINHHHTNPVKMTPAHPQAANRPRLILRSDSFTHEDLSAAFAASASQPRTKDLKIRIAQKDETPAPPPSPTEAFSSHRP